MAAIRKAQVSGLLRSDVSPYLAADLLFGPLFYRMLIRHEPLTEDFVDRLLDCFLDGLRALKRTES